MSDKLTDNEIIKALECCNDCDCRGCPCNTESGCVDIDYSDVLDLINRQKAEIEVLSQKRANIFENISFYEKGRTEAIKEFADRLKEKYSQADILCPRRIVSLTEKDLDNLVKEMVGDDNG